MSNTIGNVNIGIHVFKKTDMASSIIETRNNLNVNAVQIFTHGPRNFKKNNIQHDDIIKACDGINLYIHSPYPTNPWKEDDDSITKTMEQFITSYSLGSKGIVLHIPKIPPNEVIPPIVELVKRLKENNLMKGQKVILEMKAVKKDAMKSYESPEKINRLIRLMKNANLHHSEVGICIDTAHIYAGQADITTYEQAEYYCNALKYPEWICLLHLNGNEYDSKKRAGDKHAIPLDKLDKIWDGLPYTKSGCKAFIQYAHKIGIDIILEVKGHHTDKQVSMFLDQVNTDIVY